MNQRLIDQASFGLRRMDASIFVVGDHVLCQIVQALTFDAVRYTTKALPNPNDAKPFVLAQQPDVLLLQFDQSGAIELCQCLKTQSDHDWIYVILIDCQETLNSDQEIERRILALEAGADAFLSLKTSHQSASNSAGYDSRSMRLLKAQVQAGLRLVSNSRQLIQRNVLLSAIALSDPLTELNNRRAFEWELPRQVQESRSKNMSLSILMLDADHFKSINDHYGHPVGDEVLKLLAARMRNNLRSCDIAFRYGGEEFAIILANTLSDEALGIAQRLCHLIHGQPFSLKDGLVMNLTISVGVATLMSEDDEKGESLVQRADQCLLQAKRWGRNCVVSPNDLEMG